MHQPGQQQRLTEMLASYGRIILAHLHEIILDHLLYFVTDSKIGGDVTNLQTAENVKLQHFVFSDCTVR